MITNKKKSRLNIVRKILIIASSICFIISFSFLLLLRKTDFNSINHQKIFDGINHSINLIIIGAILLIIQYVIKKCKLRDKAVL